MALTLKKFDITSECLTALFKELKIVYKVDNVEESRKEQIIEQVKKYGYLPYSHIKALEELTPAETILGLEEKFKINNTFMNEKFIFRKDSLSPVKRAGFSNSDWIKTEQHNIKLINLAGLGNGNESKEPGKFIDWLKQLLILPAGNLDKRVLSTTIYLIPFHPRDFGCAYLPTSSGVSPNLEDPFIKEKFSLDAKDQVRLFLALAQLAGHPTMFDVLPQTGRFSKTVLANPYIARWFNVKSLIDRLIGDLDEIGEELKSQFHWGDVDYVKGLIADSLKGKYHNIENHHQHLACRFEEELDHKRIWHSNEMLSTEYQEKVCKKATEIINRLVGKEKFTEEDITNQNEIIGELIKEGFWTAPGGAWCSSGVPVFNKMSNGGGHPLFKHYDFERNDVTHFANLDCQTPYYFVHLETGEYNEKVIDFYVNFMKKLQFDYNFDGFRVDHIDHIVDKYSEYLGRPISYRAPRYVLGRTNTELKKACPHFATLAEYMLWDRYYKEYHRDMDFDLLWGNDIVSQFSKDIAEILADNEELIEYNSDLESGLDRLSILKTYNNQDGEFRSIDQYPGQLSAEGALFKWFKFKFLPSGKLAQRPVMYIDGDESFTKIGIEKVIGSEESMVRAKNHEFFRKFDAINRFALNNELTRYGVAEINQPNDDESGFVSWYIKSEDIYDNDEMLFIVANENPPTEVIRCYRDDGTLEIINKTYETVYNRETIIPDGYKVISEYILPKKSLEFEEVSKVSNIFDNKLIFEKLDPSEFHIYKIKKI